MTPPGPSPALGREAGRLRRAFKRATWAAIALGQVGVGFVACGGDATNQTTASGSGASTSSGSAGANGTAGGASGGHGGGTAGGGGTVDRCAPVAFEPKGDAGDDCGVFKHLPCGIQSAKPEPECYLSVSDCPAACGVLAFNCHAIGTACVDGAVIDDPDAGVDLDCTICANGVGRAPEGYAPRPRRGASASLGGFMALAAELEAVSVHAFSRLADDLARHAAPPRLVHEAERAARDERRHARRTARVSRRLGVDAPRPRPRSRAGRALEEIARENAVEGCVRETFGALVATWQGEHAQASEVGALLRGIAGDETRHAALSWSVARWCLPRLAPVARQRVAKACRAAITALRDARDPAGHVACAAGLPRPAERVALIDSLERSLWRELIDDGRRGREGGRHGLGRA